MISNDAPGWPRIFVTFLLLAASWLGVNAVWGLTSASDTLVSRWERELLPLTWWVLVAVAMTTGAAIVFGIRRQRNALRLSVMLLAYFVGVALSRYARFLIDPADTIVDRGFMLLGALPMIAVAAAFGTLRDHPLRIGDWSVATRLFSRDGEETPWSRRLPAALLFVALPVAILLQLSVGFAPFTSGRIWQILPVILALALLNGTIEELLFRGMIQPPLIGFLGPGWGIWLQALFFGVHHWGASPSLIAGLPTAVFLVLVGAVFGKSALETRGLGWAISVHVALDIGMLAAYLGS